MILIGIAVLIASGGSGLAADEQPAPPADTAEPAAPAPDGLFDRDRLTGNWYGLRPRLEAAGVQLGGNYIGEVLGNPSGGVRQTSIYEGRIEAFLNLDLDKLLGWSGAVFHANAYQISGRGLSTNGVGNLLTASNIEAVPATRLFDLWLEQDLLDHQVSVRLGEIAADDEFFISQYAGSFVNATFGWPAVVGANLPSGGLAYPLATPGIRIRGAPLTDVTITAAAFNGNPAPPGAGDPQRRNASGTDFTIGRDAFLIAEAAYVLDSNPELATPRSQVKLGGWYHTGRFADQRLDTAGRSLADPASSGVAASHRGDWGLYAVADHMLWQRTGTGDQGLAGFLRAGGAPANRNLIAYYADAGLTFKGLLAGRDGDVLGLAFAYARIGDAARQLDRDAAQLGGAARPVRDYEAVVEATYQAQIAPWWILQPDVQLVLHPGGHAAGPTGGPAISDALILGLRASAAF